MEISVLAPLPETVLPPEELLPEEEEPEDFFAPSPVSFAIVSTPTEPSSARPLLFWKLLTAFSVTSPKYPVTLDEDR